MVTVHSNIFDVQELWGEKSFRYNVMIPNIGKDV
jgi:hypothetical protein